MDPHILASGVAHSACEGLPSLSLPSPLLQPQLPKFLEKINSPSVSQDGGAWPRQVPHFELFPLCSDTPLCWHQERGPGGLGSDVRALGLGLLWLLKDREGGSKAPSFLYQLSSPAGDPQAVTSWQPQPYLHRQIRTGKSSF